MLIALLLAVAEAPAPLFDPATGYRIAQYRAPVGEAPPGVARIDDQEAAAIVDKGKALLIDVTPAEGAVWDGTTHRWQLSQGYSTIPQAHWFPDAGRWPIDPAIEQWFEAGVDRLAHRRHRLPIVVFCRADCWMSWNASWKLARRGYTAILWYANGNDGFRDLGRPMQEKKAEE